MGCGTPRDGRGLCPQPAGHRRVCSLTASPARGAALGRLARGAGAEDDGASGEQEAAGEGKHQ